MPSRIDSFLELFIFIWDASSKFSSDHMQPSATLQQDADRGKDDSTWRTSTNYFVPSGILPELEAIDARISRLTRTRPSQQERIQVI